MNEYTNGYHNGNGNGNGNGHQKAFVLERPKTPDELEREKILEMMPKLRRECSRDRRLCVGAKWFFGQLTDLSFLYAYGGNGFGVVQLSIKDFHRIYGHDEESFEKWRDQLTKCGWIWFHKGWPTSQWGISAVCKQPELGLPFNPSYVDHLRIKAKAASQINPTEPALCNGSDKTEESGHTNGFDRVPKPALSDSKPENSGQQSRETRIVQPGNSGDSDRQTRLTHPTDPATQSGDVGFKTRDCHGSLPDKPPQLRSIPIGVRSNGTSTHTQEGGLPEFEALDLKMAPRIRKEWGKDAIERCKLKIEQLRTSRDPIPNSKAVIAAYNARIKAIKDFVAGEVSK